MHVVLNGCIMNEILATEDKSKSIFPYSSMFLYTVHPARMDMMQNWYHFESIWQNIKIYFDVVLIIKAFSLQKLFLKITSYYGLTAFSFQT